MDTIKNISLLSQMQSIAALLLSRIEALENEGGMVHAIDADLLRDKTRTLYDLMLRLHENSNFEFETPQRNQSDIPLTLPVFEINEPERVQKHSGSQESEMNENIIPSAKVDETEVMMPEEPQMEEPANAVTETTEEYHPQHTGLIQSEINRIHTTKKETHSPMYDLFGDNTTLADAFNTNDNSIASRIEKASIKDLREAIGINDKFLMINELFEGNISYYNRAIDELNGFQSFAGAKTYLIELSVQHQWNAESVALVKITQLIERKFNNGF